MLYRHVNRQSPGGAAPVAALLSGPVVRLGSWLIRSKVYTCTVLLDTWLSWALVNQCQTRSSSLLVLPPLALSSRICTVPHSLTTWPMYMVQAKVRADGTQLHGILIVNPRPAGSLQV